jgi:hypothetical protein
LAKDMGLLCCPIAWRASRAEKPTSDAIPMWQASRSCRGKGEAMCLVFRVYCTPVVSTCWRRIRLREWKVAIERVPNRHHHGSMLAGLASTAFFGVDSRQCSTETFHKGQTVRSIASFLPAHAVAILAAARHSATGHVSGCLAFVKTFPAPPPPLLANRLIIRLSAAQISLGSTQPASSNQP